MKTSIIAILATGCMANDLSTIESELAGSIQSVGGSTRYDGAATKQLDIVCPTGMVGTHVSYGADDGAGALTSFALGVEPLGETGQRWRVRATDPDQSPYWKLDAFLTCIPTPSGYELVAATTGAAATDTHELQIDCPPGKLPIGAGFTTSPETRLRIPGPLLGRLTSSMPSHGESWFATARSIDPRSTWSLDGTLVCADAGALPGYGIGVEAQRAPTVTPALSSRGRCPTTSPQVSIAGGWIARDASGGPVEAFAYSEGRYRQFTQWGWQTWATSDSHDPWTLELAAICVD